MPVKQKPRILTPKDTYTFDYPDAIKAAESQMAIIWFATELGVEKDEHDVRVNLTEGERYGLIETSKLFTSYELRLGDEFWGNYVMRTFPRPDIQRMANCFSFIELNVHAPFYSLVNQTLKIDTDEFYSSWKEDPVLVERMKFLDQYVNGKCPLRSTAAFAFTEGAILFSNFAYFKSLNSGGFNMCSHFAAGIDASVKDENFHSMASAWLHNQTLSEMMQLGLITKRQITRLRKDIYAMAQVVFEHEKRIIERIHAKGGIRTITVEQMIEFVMNRIDTVLAYLNMEPLFGIPQGTVSEWFYKQLSSYKYADFFSNQQIQYKRDWNRSKFYYKRNKKPAQVA